MATANLLQTSVSGGTQNALALQGDGVFFPKASTASRLALTLTTTDKGFVVYDTTDSNIYFWNGTAWESIPGSGDAGANGSVQYNDNGIVSGATNFIYDKATGNVGVGGFPTGAAAVVLVEGTAGTYARFNSKVGAKTWSAGYRSGTTNFEIQEDLVERLVIANGGNVGVGVTPVAGNGAIQLSAGVGFPATQVASANANTLDDYEEGTWTPIDSSGAGLTFSTAAGTYTKIGRQVIVYYNVTFPVTASTALITIGGLPFAAATSPSVANPGSGSITFQTSSISNASFAIAPTASTITVFTLAGTAVTNVSASTFTIRASYHYITN